jgi:hypothetical protein
MPLTRKRFLNLAGRGALGAAAYSTLGFLGRAEAGETKATTCRLPGTDPSDPRFLYRGSAVGIGGRITDPPHGEIPAQAATTLPPDGGYAEAIAKDFDFKGIVRVAHARGFVSGNPDCKGASGVFRTVATATVSGLDVDGVLTADTVVANLESEQLPNEKLNMRPVSYVTNLRIRGVKLDLEPDSELMALGTDDEMSRYLGSSGRHTPMKRASGKLVSYSIFDDESVAAAVKKVNGIQRAASRVTLLDGGHIHVDDFGDIFLGELFFDADFRRLTTLRIVLGSPPSGVLDVAAVEGDGRPS